MTKKLTLLFIITFTITFFSYGQNKSADKLQYWNLPTGSKISYTYIKGKEPRKNTPIIYLHGGPGGYYKSTDIETFGKLADDGYDVYLYDQIGGGKSERLHNIMDYTIDRHLKDLEAIVNKIGNSKVIFIGHSWGASLAPLYLAEHPNRVEKLILSGPGGIIPKTFNYNLESPDSLNLKKNNTVIYNNYLNFRGNRRLKKICLKADQGEKIATDAEMDSLFDCLVNKKPKKNQNKSLKTMALIKGAGGYSNHMTGKYLSDGNDNRDQLSKLNIPVLILLGDNDNLPWACVNDYLHVFKNCKLIIIPNSAHSVFSYQAELCLKLTREFLIQ